MQTGTRFREPLWTILFPEQYEETVRVLVKDWVMIGGLLVSGLIVAAWTNSIL